ncbi:major facilitator superfamily domain-containing protein [Lipomyces tetrasporus]|uniref:Major facilitator superfamily domain-containing protein n=1 Tax=Lipomyces tetrasporus TaxID=54092 RepID=A0AAD7QX68_9ASCO|nr:major facilitator superfamily domain-containing protein [Lipomyces tetrasporus]KAJ8103079.1 major facilitator superfamily domain-containing protein [Lipomyces tetrasporus]
MPEPLARPEEPAQLPPEVVNHGAGITDSDIEDVTEPLLPTQTRATLPNPFVSGLSSRTSSFTASLSSSTRGILPSASSGPSELSTMQLTLVFLSLYIGVFLAALDGTVVATLLSHIASEFDGFRNESWIATAYLIACAAFQPLYGKLTDIFGRKPGLMFSNITFGVGCVACGLATNLWFLVFARVVAGIGGGGLTALSTITLSDLVPLRRRGVLQGFGNIMFGSGAALGGIFGGAVTAAFGWRWAFLLQVPLIVLSTFAIWFLLDLPVKDHYLSDDEALEGETELAREERLLGRIDFTGAATLVLSLIVFLFAVSIGGNQLPWTHPVVLISLPISLALLALYIYIELRVAREPIIPVQLLKDRTIFGAAFCNWFMTMSVYSLLFYIPLYFVSVRDVSETRAGSSLVSNFVGVAVGSFGSGIYMRATGLYYNIALLSAGLYIVGTGLICTLGLDTSMFAVIFYTFLPGAAYGSLLTITLIALIAAVPQEFQAVTTSIQYGFRGTGSTLGVAIASSVFQNVLGSSLRQHVFGSDAEEIINRILESVDEVKTLPSYLIPVVREAYLDASRAVFVLCCVLGVATAASTMLMREHVLHSTLDRR